jgi:hypothetical protein
MWVTVLPLLLVLQGSFGKDADQHSKLLACSDLARVKFDTDLVLVEEILKRSRVSYEKASVKLLAVMIEGC